MIKLVAASLVTLVAFATFASESTAPAPTAEPTAECCPCKPRTLEDAADLPLAGKPTCCKCNAQGCT